MAEIRKRQRHRWRRATPASARSRQDRPARPAARQLERCAGRFRAWVEAATTAQINGFGTDFYGYFFWLGRSLVDRHEIRWAAAVGLGGQRIFIVAELDLVVVMNAGLYKSPTQGLVPIKALNEYVLKAASWHSP